MVCSCLIKMLFLNIVYFSGIIGDWKNFMTEEMSKQIDDLVARELKDTKLQLYEL